MEEEAFRDFLARLRSSDFGTNGEVNEERERERERERISVTQDDYHRLISQRVQVDVDPRSDPREARFDLVRQPRQPINSEESETSSEEIREEKEMAEDASSSESDISIIEVNGPISSGTKICAEYGNFLGVNRALIPQTIHRRR